MHTGMTFGAPSIKKAPSSPTISTAVNVKQEQVGGENIAATAPAAAAVAAPTAKPLPTGKKAAPKRRKSVKYCKAPQAPKRFKSAFIFFTMARHKEIRKKIEEKEGKGDRTPDVAKIISEEWRNLSTEDRAVWDEKARLDKERYEVEKAMYTGPWKIPAKMKSQKDPGAPKRPMSSFLSYSNSKRADLKRKHPGISNADASKLLAKMWREAPEEEKREHIEREERLRKVYKVEIAQWRDRNKKKQEDVREKREEAALRYIDNRAKGIVDDSDLIGGPWGEHYHYHGTYEGSGPAYGDPHYPPPPQYHGHGHPPPPPPHGYPPIHQEVQHREPSPHGPPPPPYGAPPPNYPHHGPPPPQYHYGNGRDAPPPPPPPGHYGHYDEYYGYGPPPPPGPSYHHHDAPAPAPAARPAPAPAPGHDGGYHAGNDKEEQQHHQQRGAPPSEHGDSRGYYYDSNDRHPPPPQLSNRYDGCGGYGEHYHQQPHDAPPSAY